VPWRGESFEGEFPTLGYDVLDALSETLPSPADSDEPLIYTDEQARWFLAWFALEPETGAFIYRRACLEMAKGWGKSPMIGSLAIAELALPVLFAGWDANGEPVGRPWGTQDSPPPWVQIAAVSEDQTDNTFLAGYELLTVNDGRAADDLGIDVGRMRLYLRGRPGRLEPVTASSGSREGQRLTFAVLDEPHLWLPSNHGTKLAATLRRNLAKMAGRSVETTNAPAMGEHSVAEATGTEAEEGAAGIFYYARRAATEPDPGWSDEQLRAELVHVYGDARWVDPDRILAEVRDPATDWTDSLRYFYNLRVAAAGRAVDPRRWDELARPKTKVAAYRAATEKREGREGAAIGIGFAYTGAASLRACTSDGFSFSLGYWAPPPGAKDWVVPRAEVHEAIASAFEMYQVGRMLCDPPRWRTEVEVWAELYGDEVVLALETNQPRRFSQAVDRWLVAVREGTHTHDGDPRVTADVHAANLRKVAARDPDDDGRTMYVLERESSKAGAVADVLALEAAATMPEVGEVTMFSWV
jgi:hypothetical protein